MILTPGTEELITLLVTLVAGVVGMPMIDWLKKQFGLEDQMALLFVYLISAAVGVLGLLLSGQVFEIEFTLANAVAIAGVFAMAAKYAYERLKAKNA